MKIKKAIITGINGGAGSLLSSLLVSRGYQIRGLSMRATNVRDITNELRSFDPDYIFHTASVMDSSNLTQQVSGNLNLSLSLAESITHLELKNRPMLVNLSSAAELGLIPDSHLPVTENFLCKPVSSYGLSKLIQTETLQMFATIHEFSFINARLFNILWSHTSKKQLLNMWIQQLEGQKTQKEFSLVTGDLSISRDFINAEVAMTAIIELAELDAPSGTYNIAGGKEIILKTIIEHLSNHLEKKIHIINNPHFDAKNQPKRVVADLNKTNSVLKNKISFDLNKEIQLALIHSHF